MRTPVLCLALAALSACGSPFGHDATLYIWAQVNPDNNALTGALLWYYAGTENDCETLTTDARATANGVELTAIDRGQVHHNWLFGNRCDRPNVLIPPELLLSDPELHVTLVDRGGSVGLTVMNVAVRPSVTITPDATGHIRAGSTIGLHYSPATDDISETELRIDSPPGPSQTWDQISLPLSSFFQGMDGSFTIPPATPAGMATIWFGGRRLPKITSCEVVSQCVADYPWGSGSLSLEIEP